MTAIPTKAACLKALLREENVLVHLDPRSSRVIVPAHLKKEPLLVLQLGYALVVPITDLQIDDEPGPNAGWSGTLSFNRTPFRVFVPWDVVYAVVGEATQRFQTWSDVSTEDLQKALAAQASKERASVTQLPLKKRSVAERAAAVGLRLVKK